MKTGQMAALLLVALVVLLLLAGCGRAKDYYNNRPISSDDPAAPGRPGDTATVLTGKVVDEQGKPVEGAIVTPSSRDKPPRPIPEIAVMTDAQGSFTWHLPGPGNYDITVIKEGYRQVTLPVMAGPGNNQRDFILPKVSQ